MEEDGRGEMGGRKDREGQGGIREGQGARGDDIDVRGLSPDQDQC